MLREYFDSFFTQFKIPFLRWWLFFSLQLGVAITAHYWNLYHIILQNDKTKISFLIMLVFVLTTIWIGKCTYHVTQDRVYDIVNADVGWFISEACLALGMIGTVSGFIFVLNSAFGSIDVSNIATLQKALSSMATGMSTALWTTLTGLVCSLSLKIQLVNLEKV